MSTSGGYHEYIRGISRVHQGDIMSTSRVSWVLGGCSKHKGHPDVCGEIS